MHEKNNNKVVVVTGCSSGIGKATAEILSAKGYRVIATVRRREQAQGLQLKASDLVLELDLSSSQSVETAVSNIRQFAAGQLYAIFNNAAYGQPGAVEDLSREALTQQFETNVFGTHQLTQLLIPDLLKQKRAHIVQCSSILGLIGMPMRGAYVASKYALEGLTDTLRMELSDTAIQVSLVEPGPIQSRFRHNALIALKENVNFETSRHGWRYESVIKRLSKEEAPSKHTLAPEAVAEKVMHALEAKKAKSRYYVTTITYVVAYLKRFVSAGFMDSVLLKYAKKE